MKKFFSKTVLEPVGLADSSNIMYLNMDGTILSSWDRSIQLGQKTEKKLLKQHNRNTDGRAREKPCQDHCEHIGNRIIGTGFHFQ